MEPRGTFACPICWVDVQHKHDEVIVAAWRWSELASDDDLSAALSNRNWHEGEARARFAGRELRRRLQRVREELTAMAQENIALAAKIRLLQPPPAPECTCPHEGRSGRTGYDPNCPKHGGGKR